MNFDGTERVLWCTVVVHVPHCQLRIALRLSRAVGACTPTLLSLKISNFTDVRGYSNGEHFVVADKHRLFRATI